MKRKPIALSGTGTCVYVICNDGTIWNNWNESTRKPEEHWKQCPDVPQPKPEDLDAPGTFYVDIPTLEAIGNPDGPFVNAGNFTTRREALAFATEEFGADEDGSINLVSGG